MVDYKKRSLAKTITWRILAASITLAVLWMLTGSLALSLWGTLLANGIKTIAYFLHERAWNKYEWGRQKE